MVVATAPVTPTTGGYTIHAPGVGDYRDDL